MTGHDEAGYDVTGLVVPRVGRLSETGELWEPYRLLDPAGRLVEPVAVYLRDLQAAGRSAATQRSYAVDLLRWFRFLWATGVPWERASRVESRDFSRWLRVVDKPARTRAATAATASAANAVTG
nr:site-specific integrase [Micromonospora sp. DSM 115978]